MDIALICKAEVVKLQTFHDVNFLLQTLSYCAKMRQEEAPVIRWDQNNPSVQQPVQQVQHIKPGIWLHLIVIPKARTLHFYASQAPHLRQGVQTSTILVNLATARYC